MGVAKRHVSRLKHIDDRLINTRLYPNPKGVHTLHNNVHLSNTFFPSNNTYTNSTIVINTSFEIGFDSLASLVTPISLQPHTYTLCILCVSF